METEMGAAGSNEREFSYILVPGGFIPERIDLVYGRTGKFRCPRQPSLKTVSCGKRLHGR